MGGLWFLFWFGVRDPNPPRGLSADQQAEWCARNWRVARAMIPFVLSLFSVAFSLWAAFG
jgi:hypothetical protein